MCGGAKGADCTPTKWYNFMGNVSGNKYVPFQTNYITEPVDGYTSFNSTTVPCNQAVDVSSNIPMNSNGFNLIISIIILGVKREMFLL